MEETNNLELNQSPESKEQEPTPNSETKFLEEKTENIFDIENKTHTKKKKKKKKKSTEESTESKKKKNSITILIILILIKIY